MGFSLDNNYIESHLINVTEFISVYIDEIFDLKQRKNDIKIDLNNNTKSLARLKQVLEEFRAHKEKFKDQISEPELNQICISYNDAFHNSETNQTTKSSIFFDNGIRSDQINLEMSNGFDNAITIFQEKSYNKIAQLGLSNTKGLELKDLYISIIDKTLNKKISHTRVSLLDVFAGLNPENLKVQIVPPVYLQLEFSCNDNNHFFGGCQKDDLEIKFEFRITLEMRYGLIQKLINHLIRSNEVLQNVKDDINKKLSRYILLFEEYSFFSEYEELNLQKHQVGCIGCGKVENIGCGIEKCILF